MDSPNKYLLDKYPLHVKINFINLFKVEIADRLNQNPSHWFHFNLILGDEKINFYFEKQETFDTDEEKKRVTSEFFIALKDSGNNGHLYSELMNFFNEVDRELYRMMCLDEWKKESYTLFLKLVNVSHKILPIMNVEKVIKYLSEYSAELNRYYAPVFKRWNENEIDDEYAKSLIFRTLCIMSDSAGYHLMNAIFKSSEKGKEIIEGIIPNFEIFYQKNIFEDRDGIIHIVEEYDDVSQAIEDIMTNNIESKYAKNIYFDDIPPHHMVPLMYQNSADNPFNIRDYQIELAEEALKGENVLICAPTGSGKTVVAAYIIQNHIFCLRKQGKTPKIVFVVPNVVLVEQQCDLFKKYMKGFATIFGIHGGTEDVDFHSRIKSVDILVLTPQILVNFTDPLFCHYEGKDPVGLNNFTLIILDEVHHTNKDHPYNKLMAEYHRQKYGDGKDIPKIMPQVIGMSATIGCPKKPKNVMEVIDYMIDICANFDAIDISRVIKNVEELETFVSKTQEEKKVIETNDSSTNEYYEYITQLSKAIENYLRNLDGISEYPEIFKDHCDIKKTEYITWLSITLNKTLPLSNLAPASKKLANDCLEYLRMLYEAFQCSKIFPTQDTTEFYLENLGKIGVTELDKFVYEKKQQIGKFPCSECDVFQKLVSIIKDQFDKNPASRIIIYLPQRFYCLLASNIIERYTGKKGTYISSSNAPAEFGGCNANEQQKILENFRNSPDQQILFSTSVSEEGVDVPGCNLVIKYQYATNRTHFFSTSRNRVQRQKSKSAVVGLIFCIPGYF